jgi:hypothetical protein
MTYSLPTLLADPDRAQLVLLRAYLFSIAGAVSSQANALELAEPWNFTGINALREKRDYLRRTAWLVTKGVTSCPATIKVQ